jgi:lipopolysaccharide export LptBFGC system permease protein LptF
VDLDRRIYLLGGVAAIVGSLMGMVGNLIHPVTPLDDPEGVARVIAESDAWTAIHLVIVFGITLMLGGLVALYQSIRDSRAGALARLGLAAGIVGIAIGVVLVILDGVGAKQLADEWAIAPQDERATALRIVLANETINFALASSFNIVFAGATFILFGLAVATSGVYRRSLGLVVVVAGIASVGAGLIQAFVGEPTTASRVLTIIGPTVITLWLLAIGVLLVRKARQTA